MNELREVPKNEIDLVTKINHWLFENKIENSIDAIRKLVHLETMPFTKTQLEDFKLHRENEFRRFARKERLRF